MHGTRWWVTATAALAALASITAFAGRYDAARAQAQASMVVTGSIDIGTDGAVLSYRLDKPELLPAAVTGLAAKAIPQWRFAPVLIDDKAVHARTRMYVRFIAKRDGEQYLVRIGSANFGASEKQDEKADAPVEYVSLKSRVTPGYPTGLNRAGFAGTVYTVLRIGRDGTVEDAAVEQVNLRVIGSDRAMEQAREQFTNNTLAALRRWTFTIPQSATEPYWLLRVPVSYVIGDLREPEYGKWDVYVPGPRHALPWLPVEAQQGNDAMIAGGIYPIGTGPKLLTHLDG